MGTPYRECPNCGAHLDAGELCDCRRTEREPRRPEQEPRKPMRLMAICREIDKDTGRIAVYPLKMEIDDRILGALKVRATMNPELRYFVLVSARWEKYGTVIAGILKRRSGAGRTWTRPRSRSGSSKRAGTGFSRDGSRPERNRTFKGRWTAGGPLSLKRSTPPGTA